MVHTSFRWREITHRIIATVKSFVYW